MYDSPETFREDWIKIFALLPEAQLAGKGIQEVEGLLARYLKLAGLAGPDLLQEFIETALVRLEKTAPTAAERLRNDLTVRGVLKERAALQGNA